VLISRVKVASLLAIPALFLGVAVTGSPAATAAAPARAHLDKVGSTNLKTTTIRLRSSTGQRLFAEIFVDRFSWHVKHPRPDVQVALAKRGESHSWQFELHKQTFAFHLASGHGRLVAGSKKLDKFGNLDLTLTSRGASTLRSCGAGVAERITPVKVTGRFVFRSHTSGAKVPWGSVGNNRKTVRFKGRNIIDTDYGNPNNACFNPPARCASDVHWFSFRHQQILQADSFVKNGKRHGFLIGENSRKVGGHSGPERSDTVFAPFPVPKAVATGDGGESVAVVSNGRHGVTGSATLTSVGDPQVSKEACKGGSLTARDWPATYTNGSTPLTLSEDIGGPLTQPNEANGAGITIDSFPSQPASTQAAMPSSTGFRTAMAREIRRTTLAQWRARK
jgi:hypothetical protein